MIPTDQIYDFKDRKIKLHKVSLGTENLWMLWASKRLPNPLEALRFLKDLPSDVAKEVSTQAYRDFKRGWSIDDEEITSLKKTPEGLYHHLRVLIQAGEKITEEQACDLLDEIIAVDGHDQIVKTALACAGLTPDFFDQETPENQAS